MDSKTCVPPSCHNKGAFQTLKVEGINTMIQCSKERGDDIHMKLQEILDSSGENATVECHKACYCAYTSRQNLAKYLAKKRREGFATSDSEQPSTRVRRSYLPKFQFKKHCLICGKECLPSDPKHPDRWEQII